MQATLMNYRISKTLPIVETFEKYVGRIVLQPTTLCNLNCSYCYLVDRKSNFSMPVEIAQAIAKDFKGVETPITVIWHGGEPLTTGHVHFTNLLEAFDGTKVGHAIQTNATLIDDEWCEIFKKYSINIGISIDGPSEINSNRVDFGGKETVSKVEKGVNLLRKYNIDFGIIAVVNKTNINNAKDILEYAINLGAHSLAINIEEIEGVNTRTGPNGESVTQFWRDLWNAWNDKPIIRIREFDNIGKWVTSAFANKSFVKERIDLFPTIAWNGDVVLFSPELHSIKSKEHNNFIIGNVSKTSLLELMKEALPNKVDYVDQYLEGINMCKNDCSYFQYCRGGYASNKYAEHKKLNVTETISCRNSRKRLINAILENKIEPRNSLELNSMMGEGIDKFWRLRKLMSHPMTNVSASGLGSDYDKWGDFNNWDDFDKIIFADYDDDGNQTGITIGGH